MCQSAAQLTMFRIVSNMARLHVAMRNCAICVKCLHAQDYRVHIKHTDGSFEYVPYFCLPANDLSDVIAPSCYSCFDYTNALADLVRPAGGCWQSLTFACCT